MIINIAYPDNGTQISFEFKEENKWAKLYDRKIGDYVDGDQFGDGLEGCVFQITGGSDKNGFPMKQGVATQAKKKLLLAKGSVGYFCRRSGTRKRKHIRGCILGREISSINLILIKKGEKELKGLTDTKANLRLGPKRANKIRKMFNIPRHSNNIGVAEPKKITVNNIDVCRVVVRRLAREKDGKKFYKAPKITRLMTAERIRRKKNKKLSKLRNVQRNQEKMKIFKKMLD